MVSPRKVCLCATLAAAFFIRVVTATPDCQVRTDGWQRYTASGEEVSAMFSELPAMSTYDNFGKGDAGRKERVIAAYTGGAVLAIYSFDTSNRKQSLKQFAQEMVNSYLPGDSVKYERDVSVNGINGVEASLTGGGIVGSVQFYKTERHSYAVLVIGVERSHPTAERFFASLQFDRNPSGRQLEDGPGQEIPAAVDNPLNPKDVTRKPIVVIKPPPSFTGLAEKNRTSGTVELRVVFSATGRIAQIHTVKSLPNGLTERAVEAARRIRFIPAVKDGQFVSMWMRLEYHFWR